MAEALWVQQTGVDYAASEDRKLIRAMYTPGVVFGLDISAGSGLTPQVSAGMAVIDDGNGGAYLAYFTGTTNVGPLTANTTTTLYVAIDTTTAQATIVTASSNPKVAIGTVVTTASVSTPSTTGRVNASSSAGGTSLPLAGGTLTGPLTAPSIVVPGALTVDSTGIEAPKGVTLGGASAATMRHYAKVFNSTTQSIPTSPNSAPVFYPVLFDSSTAHFASDYGVTPYSGGKFYASVAGDYAFWGHVWFTPLSLASNAGYRVSRLMKYRSDGTPLEEYHCDDHMQFQGSSVYGNIGWTNGVYFNAIIDMLPGEYVQFEVFQSSGQAIDLEGGPTAGPTAGRWPTGKFRLIMAD